MVMYVWGTVITTEPENCIAGYAMVKIIRRWKLKSDLAAKDHSPIKGKKIQKTKSDEMLFTEGDDLFDDLDLSEFDELSLDDFDK